MLGKEFLFKNSQKIFNKCLKTWFAAFFSTFQLKTSH